MNKIEYLEKEILEKQEELKKLKMEYENMSLTEEQQLAIKLHGKLCHWNHTDGCSWYYEVNKNSCGDDVHKWDGYAHATYLKKAKEMLKLESDIDKIIDIINAL